MDCRCPPPRIGDFRQPHRPSRASGAVRSPPNSRDFRREQPSSTTSVLCTCVVQDDARTSGSQQGTLPSPKEADPAQGIRRRIQPSWPRPPLRGGPRPKGRRRTRIPVPRTQVRTSRGLGREVETGHEKGFLRKKRTGTSQCRTSTESRDEKRKTRHEEDARTRDLAQRMPAAGEAAAHHGADGGDEAAGPPAVA